MRLATQEFRDQVITERESWIVDNKDKNPGLSVEDNAKMVGTGAGVCAAGFPRHPVQRSEGTCSTASMPRMARRAWKSKLMVNDRIADSIFQQIVTRPDEYAVLATPNLNGDYISDAAPRRWADWASLPGANIGDQLRHLRGHARHRSQVRRQGRHQSRLGHSCRE
jgi:isocitrate dehydrogenase